MRWKFFIAAAVLTLFCLPLASADVFIAGLDPKVTFVNGIGTYHPDEGKDRVVIVDYTNREKPEITASLPLSNSIFGPPTNLIVNADETMAYVANPVKWVKTDGAWGPAPDNMLHMIDLEGKPRHISSIEIGSQPSGMDITPDGSLLIVANRAEPSVSIVAIEGKTATFLEKVTVDFPTDAVSITPDGKRALFTMKAEGLVGFLHINGKTVTYNPEENIVVGSEPYNVAVSPLGNIALVNNSGPTGGNDGHVDPVCVIDLVAPHPHIIDWIGVGDGPEGLAFSPKGDIAISVLINGSQNALANPNTAWAANENGAIAVLKVDGKTVTKIKEIEVGGGMPEGVVFSPDGTFIYVGNFCNNTVTILKADGTNVVDTGKEFTLPGAPGAMRGQK